jgi:hypothetical protein
MKSVAPLGPGRSDRLLTGLYVLAVCMIGCSTQQIPVPANSAPIEAAPPSNLAEGNLAGLWTGTTSTGGLLGSAGETRNIKFDLRQVGDQITGSYRCSGGNSICRNHDETGSIKGTANGDQVNLNITVLPDASNCRYRGVLDYNGNGQYTCYLQGRIVEQGTWSAGR